jgi:hypothetical protein
MNFNPYDLCPSEEEFRATWREMQRQARRAARETSELQPYTLDYNPGENAVQRQLGVAGRTAS